MQTVYNLKKQLTFFKNICFQDIFFLLKCQYISSHMFSGCNFLYSGICGAFEHVIILTILLSSIMHPPKSFNRPWAG